MNIRRLLTISYSNIQNSNYINHVNSLKKYNYEPIVLGRGDKWINFIANKITSYRNYILSHTNDNDLIVLMDCYDVFACQDIDVFLDKLSKIINYKNDKILISTEGYCSPNNNRPLINYWKYYHINDKQRYLNSGFCIGNKKMLLHLLNYCIDLGIIDDQLAFIDYCEKYPENIILDLNSSIIGTITGYEFSNFVIKNGEIYNKKSNQYPCFIHIPGYKIDIFRMNYFGKFILKNKYISESFLNNLVKNKNTRIILILYLILFYYRKDIALIILIIVLIIIKIYSRE
jgi:hypothetical protein